MACNCELSMRRKQEEKISRLNRIWLNSCRPQMIFDFDIIYSVMIHNSLAIWIKIKLQRSSAFKRLLWSTLRVNRTKVRNRFLLGSGLHYLFFNYLIIFSCFINVVYAHCCLQLLFIEFFFTNFWLTKQNCDLDSQFALVLCILLTSNSTYIHMEL